jgi:hypothetical protein
MMLIGANMCREESGRSVKYLAKGREVMTRIIHRHFGRFIVPQDPRMHTISTSIQSR